MNAILGYSQLLRRDPELPEKYLRSVETIERSGDHLLAMINDILDLSKIEAGKMQLQCSDFDLAELIRSLSAMFALRCEQKRLHWRVDWNEGEKSLLVRGDEGKLRQVLINLLGNAVKFTEEGEVVLKMSSGFDDFIGKPFRFDEVCHCLRRHLGIEFEYDDDSATRAATVPEFDPEKIVLPVMVLEQLRDAANRYSVTKLEQRLAELERANGDGAQVAAYCRSLIERGDLEAVSACLEKIKGV